MFAVQIKAKNSKDMCEFQAIPRKSEVNLEFASVVAQIKEKGGYFSFPEASEWSSQVGYVRIVEFYANSKTVKAIHDYWEPYHA